jgi:hypothetical protein
MSLRIPTVGLAVLTAAVTVAGQGSSPAGRDSFRYERAVLPGDRGPNRLALDAQILAGGRPFQVAAGRAEGGLSDLRLYDASGREVPYLLVQPAAPEPSWQSGKLLSVVPTKKTSGFEVDLGHESVIDSVRIQGLPAPFLKRARLEGGGDRSRWTLLVAEGTLFDLPEERLTRIDLDFPPGEFRYLRLTWDDTASARVPLPAAVLAREARGRLPEAPLRVPLPVERRASEPGTSRYRLALPGPHLPLVAIELSTATSNVLREAHVTEARLSDGQVVPVTLGSAVLRRAVRGNLAAAELRVPIEAPTEPQIELTVDDGSNPPLELTRVEAVFADLPWIYFEAAGATPLVARYGRADLPSPRYDLEAERATVGNLRAAVAAFGPVRKILPTTAGSGASQLPPTGASIDLKSFAVSREIPPGPAGLQALLLDAAVLAHASQRGLGDIRIATTSGRQIPYLLERLDEPLSVRLSPPAPTAPPGGALLANPRMSGTRSYYRLELPYASLPRARLVFETTARVFDREVIVMSEPRESDARRASVTRSIVGRRWTHAEPETPAAPLVVDIDPPDSRNMLLVVDEGDNQALPLLPPRLLLPAYRLRFFRTSEAACLLLYGRADLAPPRYDLALLATQLVGAPAHEIAPGPELTGPVAATSAMSPLLFWVVLILAVLVLLAIVVRLVKQASP